MKNIMIGAVPVIFVFLLVLIGIVALPEQSVRKQDLQKDSNQTENGSQSNVIDKNTEKDIEKDIEQISENASAIPIIIIDASHSPYGEEDEDMETSEIGMQEETVGETLSESGEETKEYMLTYQLANAVCKKLKKDNLNVIVMQERNEEKRTLIEQLKPDLVVSIHIHKTSEENDSIYFKKGSKGKEIAKEVFSSKFEVKKADKNSDMLKEGSMLQSVEQPSVLLECSAETDITNNWIRKQAKKIAKALRNFTQNKD